MGASASGEVVPMPRWSSIVGCARAVVAILVLAFTAAATGIWGGYTAFGFALFTVCVQGVTLCNGSSPRLTMYIGLCYADHIRLLPCRPVPQA